MSFGQSGVGMKRSQPNMSKIVKERLPTRSPSSSFSITELFLPLSLCYFPLSSRSLFKEKMSSCFDSFGTCGCTTPSQNLLQLLPNALLVSPLPSPFLSADGSTAPWSLSVFGSWLIFLDKEPFPHKPLVWLRESPGVCLEL